jgi:uncharacterized membrane protein YeaQ/YmgE (transglycosylase-associated protein family)
MWRLTDNFLEVEMTHLLTLLVIGAVAGLMAERITDRTMPYRWIGAITAGVLGAWLITDGLHLAIAPHLTVAGIPLISAILGAMIVVFVWSMVTRNGSFGYRHASTH